MKAITKENPKVKKRKLVTLSFEQITFIKLNIKYLFPNLYKDIATTSNETTASTQATSSTQATATASTVTETKTKQPKIISRPQIKRLYAPAIKLVEETNETTEITKATATRKST